MPISDVDNVLLLILRTGDIDPITADPVTVTTANGNGIVQLNAERIWNKYIAYKSIPPAAIGSEIFDHYFMITAEEILCAVLAERTTFSAVGTAISVQLSDRYKAHLAMLTRYTTELNALMLKASAFSTPAMAPILNIMPIKPPVPGQIASPLWQVGQASVFTIDANSYALAGSPYWPYWSANGWTRS
jgi:hypothetical protein